MKYLKMASALVALSLGPVTFAQDQYPTSSSQASSQQSANSSQNHAAAQRIQESLKGARLTDAKVVAASFVPQGKSEDESQVVMTIEPHGMSVLEIMSSTSDLATSSPASAMGSARLWQGTSSKQFSRFFGNAAQARRLRGIHFYNEGLAGS